MDYQPRNLAERRSAIVEKLENEQHIWLASGSDGHGAHLIPVSFIWNGNDLITATVLRSATVRNIRAHPAVRVAIGSTADVGMIDATAALLPVTELDDATAGRYAEVAADARSIPGYTYLRLTPTRIQVWNGYHEVGGRTVLLAGKWLDNPVD